MSTVQRLRSPGPRYLILVEEETGDEIGRLEGLEWKNVAEASGTARTGDIRVTYDRGARDKTIRGPATQIGLVTNYKGSLDGAQAQRIKQLEEGLRIVTDQLQTELVDREVAQSRLKAVLQMLGGAVTISEVEQTQADLYVMEESWSPESGTSITLTERSLPF